MLNVTVKNIVQNYDILIRFARSIVVVHHSTAQHTERYCRLLVAYQCIE